MTKIDIFSGFLGAGKTTLIKKLIKEAFVGEKLVLIENEFGDIGIDGGFMQDAGIEVTEMNSGCICCSLVGDFGEALKKVLEQYKPDRILIEPSGVGKLSDVIKAVNDINSNEILLNSFTTVADAKKCKMYMKNFGEFYNNQIENAATIILSHTKGMSEEKLSDCITLLRQHNTNATLVTTDWDSLNGKQILAAMEKAETLESEIEELQCSEHHHEHECCCGHHHEEECDHEHHHEGECCHEHHHDHHHEGECCHEHHHDHHHEGECCHEHHHDHHHDEHCCHEHHHNHHHEGECCCHHDHHADEVFTSWGIETAKVFSSEIIEKALLKLSDSKEYGTVLRAKGIVMGENGWIHFDYVPGEPNVRYGSAGVIGRLVCIGAELNKNKLAELFGVEV